MTAMTLDERRAHLLPALRARRFNAAVRHITKIANGEPQFTLAEAEELCAILRAGAR